MIFILNLLLIHIGKKDIENCCTLRAWLKLEKEIFFFCQQQRQVAVPRLGMEPKPQQYPEPQK